MKRLCFIFFLIFFLISSAYSASKPFQGSGGESFSMETRSTDLSSTYYSGSNLNFHPNSGFPGSSSPNVVSFFYKTNKRLQVFFPYFVSSGSGSTVTVPMFTGFKGSDLSSSSNCVVSGSFSVPTLYLNTPSAYAQVFAYFRCQFASIAFLFCCI